MTLRPVDMHAGAGARRAHLRLVVDNRPRDDGAGPVLRPLPVPPKPEPDRAA